jgi:ParB family chromosome partitioning protein
MLLDGQLRWEAAKFLGWETIRAVIVPQPQDLDQSSLLTFLGFEDLNPLDKVEAIIKEIVKTTDFEESEISTTLATVIKRIERDGKVKELAKLIDVSSEEQQQGLSDLKVEGAEQEMFLILLELGLNPVSFRTNLMPMLSLPQDLKKAIRSDGLKGAHALALSTLTASSLKVDENTASKERARATDKVLKKNLTVPETRALIKEIKAKYLKEEKIESKEIKVVMQKINVLTQETISGASTEQLTKLKELLEQKLAAVNDALS